MAIIERGFDPRHHAWSDDHLNLRLHHLRKGEDGYLCAFLYRKAEVVVAIDRKIECSVVSFLFREVCAVLLTVEDDEEHVSRSECAVPISAVGNNCGRVCTSQPALTDQQVVAVHKS